MKEVAQEMRRYNIEILALQEIRWPQDGMISKENYTLYYSGKKNKVKCKMPRHNLFSNEELRVMVCVYSKENFNGRRAHRRYLEMYSNRRQPDFRIIENLYDRFGETGSFRPKRDSACRPKTLNPEQEEEILVRVAENSELSIRHIAIETGGKEQYIKVQTITEEDCSFAVTTKSFIVSTRHKHKREHKTTWMIPGSTEDGDLMRRADIDSLILSITDIPVYGFMSLALTNTSKDLLRLGERLGYYPFEGPHGVDFASALLLIPSESGGQGIFQNGYPQK
ncbi:hypothetical protein NQ318_008264 [Aromia moschata]|uniref:DUF4817 domain-containing protein n=1 Tax=Aromia moschata TaxID=1265417 RepID=A0AAV8XWT6_9CUCU|nr:hypothetical protein NQ318_008264 [Aromia moschata]